MKISTINEIKEELKCLSEAELQRIILLLAKHKKENRELLHFLLFESQNAEAYLGHVKEEVIAQFMAVRTDNLYYAKKGLQRISRIVNKQLKYLSDPIIKIELLIFFCQQIVQLNIPLSANKVIENLYKRQIASLDKLLANIHEDYQLDYEEDVRSLKLIIAGSV